MSFFFPDEVRADLVSLKVDSALKELKVKFPESQVSVTMQVNNRQRHNRNA